MISIGANELHRMFQQVTPHMPDPEEGISVISSIQLEARDGWLYAAATDKYTFAIARREILTSDARVGYIPGHQVAAVTAWLEGEAGLRSTVGLTLPVFKDPSEIILTTSGRGSLKAEYDADDYKAFPNWRKILHAALSAEPGVVPLTGFTTKFLARWQHAAERLTAWQEAPGKPLVLLDEAGYFAGLHSPVRYELKREDVAPAWLAAAVPTATVNGYAYDLSQTWFDRHGDPWAYSGKDCPDGMPLMVLDGIDDDPHPLDRLIWAYGPINAN